MGRLGAVMSAITKCGFGSPGNGTRRLPCGALPTTDHAGARSVDDPKQPSDPADSHRQSGHLDAQSALSLAENPAQPHDILRSSVERRLLVSQVQTERSTDEEVAA